VTSFAAVTPFPTFDQFKYKLIKLSNHPSPPPIFSSSFLERRRESGVRGTGGLASLRKARRVPPSLPSSFPLLLPLQKQGQKERRKEEHKVVVFIKSKIYIFFV
jgi:hypothetical protein